MTQVTRSLRMTAPAASALLLAVLAAQPAAAGSNSPSCTHWAEFTGTDFSNSEPTDLGCTNRRNLEHMVEDPNDLDHGRKLGPADAERESLAVRTYEQGKVRFAPTEGGASGLVLT